MERKEIEDIELVNRLSDAEMEEYRQIVDAYDEKSEKEKSLDGAADAIEWFCCIFAFPIFLISLLGAVLSPVFLILMLLFFIEIFWMFYIKRYLYKKEKFVPQSAQEKEEAAARKNEVKAESFAREYIDSGLYKCLKRKWEADEDAHKIILTGFYGHIGSGVVIEERLELDLNGINHNMFLKIDSYDIKTGILTCRMDDKRE